eukprot:6179191-Amphidinium_carterae.1
MKKRSMMLKCCYESGRCVPTIHMCVCVRTTKALDEAITVLKAGMGESLTQTTKSANLLSFRAGLKQAVQLAGQSLSAEDARFIEAVLNGQEPIMKDWKKLNRDATFKMKYEARSGKILQ